MKTVRFAGFVFGLTVVAFASHAAPDYEASVICAATHTVECDGSDEECHQGRGDTINFPQFFRVDFREREIRILDHERKNEITKVTHVARSESRGLDHPSGGGGGPAVEYGDHRADRPVLAGHQRGRRGVQRVRCLHIPVTLTSRSAHGYRLKPFSRLEDRNSPKNGRML